MAWTTPRTWVAGELVTAALGNTHWRDQFALLKTSISNDGLTWSGAVAGTTGAFSGNVSLTGASAILSFTGATAPEILFATNANARIFANQSMIFGIDKDATSSGEAFYWRINNATDIMQLNESGDLGVGTAPSTRFHVLGTGTGTCVYVQNAHASTPSGIYNRFSAAAPNNGTQYFMYCEDSSAVRLVIYSNGGISNYSANNVNLSDLGAKDIAGPAPSQRSKIRQIAMYRGRYKDSKRGHDDLMWGAQDILAIDPEWVDVWQEEERDASGAIVKPRLLGTRDHLIFLATVGVVAEHDTMLDDHETRIDRLERGRAA